MNSFAEDRAMALGEYILRTGATVRTAAAVFKISKSTVHKDVAERLKYIDPMLHQSVKVILEQNKAQRHIRGGLATQRKYREAHAAKEAVRAVRDPLRR